MKTARRTIACLLAVLLLLSIGQASAFAEPGCKNASAARLSPAGKSAETRSGTGSWLSDIRYYSDGTIASLTERIGRSVSYWEYRYDYRGGFLYRVKNIGSVPSKLAAGYMPGTDVNYSALSSPVSPSSAGALSSAGASSSFGRGCVERIRVRNSVSV